MTLAGARISAATGVPAGDGDGLGSLMPVPGLGMGGETWTVATARGTRLELLAGCAELAVELAQPARLATAITASNNSLMTDSLTSTVRVAGALSGPAQLPFHCRRDLVARQVVKAVVTRAHSLCQVGARVDGVRLVHRRHARQVLHRRQVAVVASGVDDQAVDLFGIDERRHLLRLDERLLFEHRDVAPAVADEHQERPD